MNSISLDSSSVAGSRLHSAVCAADQPVQREDLRHRLVLAGTCGSDHSRQLHLVGGQLHVLAYTDKVRAAAASRLPGNAKRRRRL